MIITLNGDEGAGKTTIAKKIAEILKFPCLNNGDFVRQLAKEKGITLTELRKLRQESPDIDYKIDEKVVQLGKTKNDFIIVGRTAFHLIPQSIKIYLAVNEKAGAERILNELKSDHDRAVEDKKLDTLEDIMASQRKRRTEDDEIYKKHYNINIRDHSNYDFVLDTSDLTIEQVYSEVMEFIKKRTNGQSSQNSPE